MKISMTLRVFLTIAMVGLLPLLITLGASAHYSLQQGVDQPVVFQGGEWSDDFHTYEWLSELVNVEAIYHHLQLKTREILYWTQTWTVHFAGGEFFHTEAISDSVQLAPNGAGQYFATGIYISRVFDAGRPVDWSFSSWNFFGLLESLTVEFRTGNTPDPDITWTNWESPLQAIGELFICSYGIEPGEPEDLGESYCNSNMSGIDSSQYIQYRATFISPDSTRTIALYDINLSYGIHPDTGMATSVLISPIDLGEWGNIILSSTVPVTTSLVIDVLAPDGTILLNNVSDGDSLASIDSHEYPAIQLRASMATSDESLSPNVRLWGVQWSVVNKIYLPAILR